MRANKVTTVGELKHLLAQFPDDTPLEVAATPTMGGWTQHLLDAVSNDDGKLTLALSLDTADVEERKFNWINNDGDPVIVA